MWQVPEGRKGPTKFCSRSSQKGVQAVALGGRKAEGDAATLLFTEILKTLKIKRVSTSPHANTERIAVTMSEEILLCFLGLPTDADNGRMPELLLSQNRVSRTFCIVLNYFVYQFIWNGCIFFKIWFNQWSRPIFVETVLSISEKIKNLVSWC